MAFFDKFKKEEASDSVDYGEEVMKAGIVLFVIPNKKYQAELVKITRNAVDDSHYKKVAYVSLNKPTKKIAASFKKDGINTKKILFIDAVTKGIKSKASGVNVTYISTMDNFEQFKKDMVKAIDKGKPGCLVFDSLSTMLIHKDQNSIIRCVHDLITKLMVADIGGKFTCLAEDMNSDLIKDVSMFVDKVINLSEKKPGTEKVDWEKKEKIAKFEIEFESVRKAYASKLLSEASYLTSKKRIENTLRKLKK